MHLPSFAILSSLLVACNGTADTDDDAWPPGPPPTDADGDGIAAEGGDCDDANAEIHPGRIEVCDGADQDCDGAIDEQTQDADGDGTCDALDAEVCNGLDDDGDGSIDEGFPDVDADGQPDCSAVEVCDGDDDDGDSEVDEGFDEDDDGTTACSGDCDDLDPARAPTLTEVDANGADEDCDGYVDEDGWKDGELVITEVMIDPAAVPDAAGEWFEVRNTTTRALVLAGLRVDDGPFDGTVDAAWRIPAGTPALEPGAFAVFAASADPSQNGGVFPLAAWEGALSLGNSGPGLSIAVEQTAGPLVIASATWDRSDRGAALVLDDVDTCAASEAWAPLGDDGSPGAKNPPCAVDGDDDGWSNGDCDDTRADTYPGAPETDPTRDQDCDGVAEQGPNVTLTASPTSSPDTCGLAAVQATVAPDPDLPLTVRWDVAAPPGSNLHASDLAITGNVATFAPDRPGVYRVTASASDSGDATGLEGLVELTIAAGTAGDPPVAEAGDNLSFSGTARCLDGVCAPCDETVVLLDGSDSSDPEAGALTYRWSVVSGWGLLAEPAEDTTTILVPGAVPLPGTTAVRTVFVSLRVTDCGGAQSPADLVAITVECTGI